MGVLQGCGRNQVDRAPQERFELLLETEERLEPAALTATELDEEVHIASRLIKAVTDRRPEHNQPGDVVLTAQVDNGLAIQDKWTRHHDLLTIATVAA